MKVCKAAFPESLRFRSCHLLSKPWWEAILNSQACCTYVCENDNKTCGVCMLIIDEALYTSKKKGYAPPLLNRIVAPILSPVVLLNFIRKSALQKKSVNTCFHDIGLPSNKRFWVELIAVCPSMQGHGFGKQLLSYVENIAQQKGLEGIKLAVEIDNLSAIAFYEKRGYLRTGVLKDKYTYAKCFCSTKQ